MLTVHHHHRPEEQDVSLPALGRSFDIWIDISFHEFISPDTKKENMWVSAHLRASGG
jgi:hypothetical protein